jgi:hypothetical protein
MKPGRRCYGEEKHICERAEEWKFPNKLPFSFSCSIINASPLQRKIRGSLCFIGFWFLESNTFFDDHNALTYD